MQLYTWSNQYGRGTNTQNWSGWFAGNAKACPGIKTPSNSNSHLPSRNPINIETRSTDIMARRDVRPPGVHENESRANQTISRHRPHDLQVSSGVYNTPLSTSSFTTQQPLYVPYPTPFMGVVPNTPTRVEGDAIQGVVEPTKETLPVTSPFQLHGGMNLRWPHNVGTTPAPVHNTAITSATRSAIPAIPSESLFSSATTLLPSTEGSSNGNDHGITRLSLRQGTTQEPNPCAEYMAPSKGPMSGGVEVTIVGTNFPHTLALSVYFSTKLALVVSWKHLLHG